MLPVLLPDLVEPPTRARLRRQSRSSHVKPGASGYARRGLARGLRLGDVLRPCSSNGTTEFRTRRLGVSDRCGSFWFANGWPRAMGMARPRGDGGANAESSCGWGEGRAP